MSRRSDRNLYDEIFSDEGIEKPQRAAVKDDQRKQQKDSIDIQTVDAKDTQ